MPTTVLLLGRTGVVVEDVQRQLSLTDVELLGGVGIADVRTAFARAQVDHVVIGAGIDLETRLQIVREIFQLSGKTTVHLKDHSSGPEGFLPFVGAVLGGLRGYDPPSHR
jgi:hypothetical protein